MYGTFDQNNLIVLRDNVVWLLIYCKTWIFLRKYTSLTYIYNKEDSQGTRLSGAAYNTVTRQLLGLRKKHSVQFVKATAIARVFLPSIKGNKLVNSAIRCDKSKIDDLTFLSNNCVI